MILRVNKSKETELSTKSKPDEENSLSTKESFTGKIGVTIGDLDKYKKDSLINIWKDANAYYSSGEEWTDEDAEFFDELAVRINTATEEGIGTVSGPAVGMVANKEFDYKNNEDEKAIKDEGLNGDDGLGFGQHNESLDQILLNETYIQDQFGVFYRPVYVGENYKEHESDLVFEGKLYTTEGVGNCPFCKGAGKITVEKLGLKDCPDCDGTGDVQGEQQMPPQQIPQEEVPVEEDPNLLHSEEVPVEEEIKKPSKHPDNKIDFKELSKEHYDKDGTYWFTTDNGKKIGVKKGQTLEDALGDSGIPDDGVDQSDVTAEDMAKNEDTDDKPKEDKKEEDKPKEESPKKDDPKTVETEWGTEFENWEGYSYKSYEGDGEDLIYTSNHDENLKVELRNVMPNEDDDYDDDEDDYTSNNEWHVQVMDNGEGSYPEVFSERNGDTKQDAIDFQNKLVKETDEEKYGYAEDTNPSYKSWKEKGAKSTLDNLVDGSSQSNWDLNGINEKERIMKETGIKVNKNTNWSELSAEQQDQLTDYYFEDKKVSDEDKSRRSDDFEVKKSTKELVDQLNGKGKVNWSNIDGLRYASLLEERSEYRTLDEFSNRDQTNLFKRLDKLLTTKGIQKAFREITGIQVYNNGYGLKNGGWSKLEDIDKIKLLDFNDSLSKKSKESKVSESCGCKTKGLEASISKYEKFIKTEINVLKTRAKAGEAVGLMYGLPTVRKNGKKIKGTLAYAGVSLNDRIYLPEELAKGHGKTLPLLLNHSSTAGAEEELDRLDGEMRDHLENEKDYEVGEVTLTWDADKLTLFYEGVIENEFFQKEVDDMDMAVSLGIFYDSNSPKVCDEECYTLIKGAEFREVSLVYHAGFPIATIEAVESKLKRASIKDIKAKASEDYGDWNKIKTDPFASNKIHSSSFNSFLKEIGAYHRWETMTQNEKIYIYQFFNRLEEGQVTVSDYKPYSYESKANEDDLVKREIKKDGSIKTTKLDQWEGKEETEEAIAEEEDELPRGGSIDAEPKETDTVEQPQIIVESLQTQDSFSVRGVSGMTISNSNGVEKYAFDPTQNYSTNTIHFSVTEQGGTIFGEEMQLTPKMTTPDELTKEIESKPDIKFTDADEDILKKN